MPAAALGGMKEKRKRGSTMGGGGWRCGRRERKGGSVVVDRVGKMVMVEVMVAVEVEVVAGTRIV